MNERARESSEDEHLRGADAARKTVEAVAALRVGQAERLKENPQFYAQGRTFQIENVFDYTLASAQDEVREAALLAERAAEAGDYYSEKSAAKLHAFLSARAALVARAIELKCYHPELASAVETTRDLDEYFEEKARAFRLWEHHDSSGDN